MKSSHLEETFFGKDVFLFRFEYEGFASCGCWHVVHHPSLLLPEVASLGDPRLVLEHGVIAEEHKVIGQENRTGATSPLTCISSFPDWRATSRPSWPKWPDMETWLWNNPNWNDSSQMMSSQEEAESSPPPSHTPVEPTFQTFDDYTAGPLDSARLILPQNRCFLCCHSFLRCSEAGPYWCPTLCQHRHVRGGRRSRHCEPKTELHCNHITTDCIVLYRKVFLPPTFVSCAEHSGVLHHCHMYRVRRFGPECTVVDVSDHSEVEFVNEGGLHLRCLFFSRVMLGSPDEFCPQCKESPFLSMCL